MTTLWQHQRDAIQWITDRTPGGAMLAHDMGTGKSLSALAYIHHAKLHRVLVVCPKAVVPIWPAELAKHFPSSPMRAIALRKGTARQKAEQVRDVREDASAASLVAVNYETAWRAYVREALLSVQWDLVIAEESHKIKSPGGKASRFLYALAKRCPRRLALTGTPMPLGPQDLYAQFRFIDDTVFGRSFTAFRARHAIMGGFESRQIVGWRNMDEIQRKFASLAHRVEARDVLDLPPCVHEDRIVEMDPSAARIYRQMDKDLMASVSSGTVTAANALARIIRLAQITSGCTVTEDGAHVPVRSNKTGALADVLADIPDAEPVVVFCRFRPALDAVRKAAEDAGRPHHELSGTCNDVGAKWGPPPGCVLGVQWQSGGAGVDLTAARYLVVYDQTYSLGDFDQGVARVVRHGQTRPVVVLHLVCDGTIDHRIRWAVQNKQNVVDVVLAACRRGTTTQHT